MIELVIQPYCDDCPHFSPEVDVQCDYVILPGTNIEQAVGVHTTVCCEHREKCRCIHSMVTKRVADEFNIPRDLL